MTKNIFGGLWSLKKEAALTEYLNRYATALKNQHFSIIYLDAFAGTGTRSTPDDNKNHTLFEDENIEFDGSAKIALKTNNPFNSYVFVDEKASFCQKLEQLVENFPTRNIEIHNKEANEFVQKFCNQTNWSKYRAVILLDPFGMEVEWETLKAIASTNAIDLLYLVSK